MNKYIVGIAALMIMVGLSTQASAAVVTKADIIFLVDESGSMGGAHDWLHGMIDTLESKLIDEGIGAGINDKNRYGLVGFGSYDHDLDPPEGTIAPADAHSHTVGGGDWGTAAEFAAATGSLADNGDKLDNYTFRAGAAVNLILVTDEGRETAAASHYNLEYGTLATATDPGTGILGALDAKNAMLNVVVNINLWDTSPVDPDPDLVALGVDSDSNAFVADGNGGYDTPFGETGTASGGEGNTLASYVNLAWDIGGAAWDLGQLQGGTNTVTSFTEAFVDIKVGEIKFQEPTPDPPDDDDDDENSSLPEPGSIVIWSLLGLAFAGAGLRRRRKA